MDLFGKYYKIIVFFLKKDVVVLRLYLFNGVLVEIGVLFVLFFRSSFIDLSIEYIGYSGIINKLE